MLNEALQQVIKEMKAHPFTLILVVTLAGANVWGWTNFARAEDLSEIKKEIKSEMGALATRITVNNSKIDRGYKLQLAESLRGLHRQLCSSEDSSVRENLQATMDGLQEDYKSVNDGNEYPIGRCPS